MPFIKVFKIIKNVFKYQNYSLFEEKAGTTINRIKKRIRNNNNLKNNKYSSLYLTQNILRVNKTMLPLINNEKSIYKDFYENNFKDKIAHKKNIKNKMINTNYVQAMKDRSFLSKIVDKNENERINKSKEEKKETK